MKKGVVFYTFILDFVTLLIDCINRTTCATEESADEFKHIMHFEEVLVIFFAKIKKCMKITAVWKWAQLWLIIVKILQVMRRFTHLCLFTLLFDNPVWEIEYVVRYKRWESTLSSAIIYGCVFIVSEWKVWNLYILHKACSDPALSVCLCGRYFKAENCLSSYHVIAVQNN